MAMGKTYDKDFKAKVALAALRGDKTIQDLSQIYQNHSNLITQWKKLILENAANLFDRANKIPDAQIEAEAKQEMLLQEVGQLQIENRFLKKGGFGLLCG